MGRIPVLITTALWVSSVVARADEPKYEFQAGKHGESVEVRAEGKQTVFAISGKGAVGDVTIRLKDGEWPQGMVIRLNGFDTVDFFSATTDRITFGGQWPLTSGGVTAFSRKMPFRFPNSKGKFEDGPSTGTLDVVVEKGKAGLDFKLPANLFVGSREAKVHWLVFIR
jgi:hypothetical protein